MLPIPATLFHATMRRSLAGALGTDPVVDERRRTVRRPAGPAATAERARLSRTPATATRSS